MVQRTHVLQILSSELQWGFSFRLPLVLLGVSIAMP